MSRRWADRVKRALVLTASAAIGVALSAAAGSAAPGRPAGNGVYVSRMKVPVREISRAITSMASVTASGFRVPVQPTAARVAAAHLVLVEADLNEAVKGLKRIEPPARAAEDQEDLASAVGTLRIELRPIITRLRLGYLVAVGTLPTLRALKTIAVTLTALQHAGYPVGTT